MFLAVTWLMEEPWWKLPTGVDGGMPCIWCVSLAEALTGHSLGSPEAWWCKVQPLHPFFWFSRQIDTPSAVRSAAKGDSGSITWPCRHNLMSAFRRGTVRVRLGLAVYSPTRRRKKKAIAVSRPATQIRGSNAFGADSAVWPTSVAGVACCRFVGGSSSRQRRVNVLNSESKVA